MSSIGNMTGSSSLNLRPNIYNILRNYRSIMLQWSRTWESVGATTCQVTALDLSICNSINWLSSQSYVHALSTRWCPSQESNLEPHHYSKMSPDRQESIIWSSLHSLDVGVSFDIFLKRWFLQNHNVLTLVQLSIAGGIDMSFHIKL